MNIGLDARNIFAPRPRGTGRNLLDAYRLIPALRPAWRFTLYHQRDARDCPLVCADAAGRWPTNLQTRRLEMPGDRLNAWFQLRLPLAARRDGVDLLHFPANAAPAWCPVPFTVTIHDLIPLKVAGEAPPHVRRRFLRGIARAVRRAAHIITPSQATADELCADFGVCRERITVIPWAPDTGLLSAGAPEERGEHSGDRPQQDLRARYRLTRPWLLNFSGTSRRKNAAGLIEALVRMSPQLRQRYQVVFVGCGSADGRAELEAQAARLGVGEQCRILGFVPHEDLPALLRGARALLMPSLCEGFGLPILDAFACGVPVLTARRSSMPEVAADAAVYCDPTASQSIADGIEQVLRDDVRERLIRAGYERVADFTWERTAQAMCEVYERSLATARPVKATCEVGPCR